jgi:hypothetical protein
MIAMTEKIPAPSTAIYWFCPILFAVSAESSLTEAGIVSEQNPEQHRFQLTVAACSM